MVGLSDIVTSMEYYADPKDSDRAWLIFGDMSGYVNILAFSTASTQLFNAPQSAWQDGLNIHLSTIEATQRGIGTPSVVRHLRFKVGLPQSLATFLLRTRKASSLFYCNDPRPMLLLKTKLIDLSN